MFVIFADFVKMLLKFTEIADFSVKISLIFVGILGNCRQLPEITIFCINFSKFARKWCKSSSIFDGDEQNSSQRRHKLHPLLRAQLDALSPHWASRCTLRALGPVTPAQLPVTWHLQISSGCKKTNPLLYKTETDFGDLQIIVLSHIFVQIIVLSLFFRFFSRLSNIYAGILKICEIPRKIHQNRCEKR